MLRPLDMQVALHALPEQARTQSAETAGTVYRQMQDMGRARQENLVRPSQVMQNQAAMESQNPAVRLPKTPPKVFAKYICPIPLPRYLKAGPASFIPDTNIIPIRNVAGKMTTATRNNCVSNIDVKFTNSIELKICKYQKGSFSKNLSVKNSQKPVIPKNNPKYAYPRTALETKKEVNQLPSAIPKRKTVIIKEKAYVELPMTNIRIFV